LTLFAVASLIGGMAHESWLLVAARALQGIGSAVIAPTSLSVLTTTFAEGEERNRALGIWGSVAAAGYAAGGLLGGLLTQWLGWRSVFFVNVPIDILCALAAKEILRESRDEAHRPRLDIWGAILVTSGVTLLVYALAAAPEAGWTHTRTLLPFVASVALLFSFVLVESRIADPLVPLGIFRRRTLVGANLVGAMASACGGCINYVFTLYFQQVLHYEAVTTGLSFLPMGLASMAASQYGARLPERWGVKRAMLAGAGLLLGGVLLLARLPLHSVFWRDFLPAEILIGVASMQMFICAAIAATTGVEDEQQGLASGLLSTTQQIGGAVGLAILVGIAAARTMSASGGNAGPLPSPQALTAGYSLALLVASGFVVVAGLVAWFVIRETDCASKTNSEAERDPY